MSSSPDNPHTIYAQDVPSCVRDLLLRPHGALLRQERARIVDYLQRCPPHTELEQYKHDLMKSSHRKYRFPLEWRNSLLSLFERTLPTQADLDEFVRCQEEENTRWRFVDEQLQRAVDECARRYREENPHGPEADILITADGVQAVVVEEYLEGPRANRASAMQCE